MSEETERFLARYDGVEAPDWQTAADLSRMGMESMARQQRENHVVQPVTVAGEADFLARHLEYIAAQPWCDEFYEEVLKLLRTLKRVNGDPDDKPAGRCNQAQADGICGGPIWIDTAAGMAHCGQCAAQWSGAVLVGLQWEMQMQKRPTTEDGRRYCTPKELADKHKVKEATIPVWAHRAGLASVDGYYHPDLASPSAMTGA